MMLILWLKRGLAWLAAHPWQIVATLAAGLAALLFRRRNMAPVRVPTPPIQELTKASEAQGRAEAHEQRAEALDAQADAAERSAEIPVEREDLEEMSDAEMAALFRRRAGR